MATFQQVLCAVDFTASSQRAMTYAAELARRCGADLTLLHVYEPPPGASGDMFVEPVEVFAASIGAASRLLARWRADAERAIGRDVGAAVATGRAARAIVRFAAERRADVVVVVASRRRSPLRRLLRASVADEVLRRAPCPVLVVSPDAEAVVRPTPLAPRRGLHLVDGASSSAIPRR